MRRQKKLQKLIKKNAMALVLALSLLFSATLTNIAVVQAATNVNQEDLISNISNTSNAKLSFNLKVPAGVTVSYKVQLIPNKRTGSLDTISGSVKNSEKKQVTKTVSVTTRYYSNKYTISASYSTGPARNRTTYSDEDSATSALKSTVTTNKFVWNDANIKKFKNGERVAVALTFALTGTVDILVSKGYLSGAVATTLSISLFAKDLLDAGSIADTSTIATTPIKGWGYQYKLSPYSGGFTKYLLVYDANGKLYQTVNLGKVSTGTITAAIR